MYDKPIQYCLPEPGLLRTIQAYIINFYRIPKKFKMQPVLCAATLILQQIAFTAYLLKLIYYEDCSRNNLAKKST
ncbi:hypothetical protein SAMN05444277_101489 [Parafilimonas terrae]|uniref:Uncharacterized protein n=1 Tax=Parafilimonas terrae TaxID=1465490 RepID=A0A1I5RYN6_9BACT|nr:hypothetical protein SAMN05444277_101489 [Parafilimonas terrae]